MIPKKQTHGLISSHFPSETYLPSFSCNTTWHLHCLPTPGGKAPGTPSHHLY